MEGLIACLATVVAGLLLAGIAYHIGKPREKRVDTYNPLSPTLRWLNVAASILVAANHGDFRHMAGTFYPGNENRPNWIAGFHRMLKRSWEIENHEQALAEMRELLDAGMRVQYRREMQLLETRYAGFSEEELIAVARRENPQADEGSYLPKMLTAYRRYGENALLGWDMGRAAFVAQCCYLVGYLRMDEMLEIGVEAGRSAQEVFHSWEEMMESYLLGGQFWKHEDKNDPRSMTAKRWKLYRKLWRGDTLFRQSPYLMVPFDLPLSTEIVTDKYGFLPEYQKAQTGTKN